MNVLLTYRKRLITQTDLSFILKVIDEYRSEGRSAISRRLCEAWVGAKSTANSRMVAAAGFYI
jgi:hypothetical protein